MKLEDVRHYIDVIASEGLVENVCFDYLDPLFGGILEDEEISKKFVSITNTHEKFIELLKNDEDIWQLFNEGCMNWQSSLVAMAHSQFAEVRKKAAENSKLIAHELMNDPEPTVRVSCLWASDKIVEQLINDPHEFVRAVCSTKDESIGLKLMNDPSVMVREWCAKAWISCAQQYVDDPSDKVRKSAIYQHYNHLAELYMNDPLSEIRGLCASKNKSCALKLKDDPDWKVRMQVLHHLTELAKYYLNDENKNVRDLAMRYYK
ncbi:hypothetical protein BEN71_12010 [Acinetobacter wuhouensis]|uniref:HEAT repeat domain-containing protein n=1 Tax=Acinetobacter wuhouensis TaxID=1879050 RepID=UPI00083A0692|nr:hypothetical protein [Acinetobacter wuhouensis]AXQ22755.1 hypothetical protein BEN71_12010 [Acinetobacter wuhouensis]